MAAWLSGWRLPRLTPASNEGQGREFEPLRREKWRSRPLPTFHRTLSLTLRQKLRDG